MTLEIINAVLNTPDAVSAHLESVRQTNEPRLQAALQWLWQLKNDQAGGWPFINRAISRGLFNVAIDLTIAYYNNDMKTWQQIIEAQQLEVGK